LFHGKAEFSALLLVFSVTWSIKNHSDWPFFKI